MFILTGGATNSRQTQRYQTPFENLCARKASVSRSGRNGALTAKGADAEETLVRKLQRLRADSQPLAYAARFTTDAELLKSFYKHFSRRKNSFAMISKVTPAPKVQHPKSHYISPAARPKKTLETRLIPYTRLSMRSKEDARMLTLIFACLAAQRMVAVSTTLRKRSLRRGCGRARRAASRRGASSG